MQENNNKHYDIYHAPYTEGLKMRTTIYYNDTPTFFAKHSYCFMTVQAMQHNGYRMYFWKYNPPMELQYNYIPPNNSAEVIPVVYIEGKKRIYSKSFMYVDLL